MSVRERFGLAGVMVAAVLGSSLWASGSAHAGTPWSCQCKGQIKRTIASTYACEVDLNKGSGRPVRSGSKLLVPRCTQTQFRAWNAKACAQIGCRLPQRKPQPA
jgi:hypothetical protein